MKEYCFIELFLNCPVTFQVQLQLEDIKQPQQHQACRDIWNGSGKQWLLLERALREQRTKDEHEVNNCSITIAKFNISIPSVFSSFLG